MGGAIENKAQPKHLKIDIESVLRSRLGSSFRFIPGFLVRWLEHIIRQKQLNELLQNNAGKTGAEFCRGVLSDLNVGCRFHGEENLPPIENCRATFVSNHPLGGLDGMILIDYVSRRHPGKEIKFVVNDLLTAVEPLNDVFLPVNKHGSQSKGRIEAIDRAFASDNPVIVFPAGLVSRKKSFFSRIHDLEWHKMFVKKSIQHKRDVIPVYFSGENSAFFYNFAKLRTLSGLKFNIEMIFLPAEVVESRNKTFDVVFGKAIPTETLASTDSLAKAQQIKQTVYSLAHGRD